MKTDGACVGENVGKIGGSGYPAVKLVNSVARHSLPVAVKAVSVIKRLYVLFCVKSIGIERLVWSVSPASTTKPNTLSVILKKKGSTFDSTGRLCTVAGPPCSTIGTVTSKSNV